VRESQLAVLLGFIMITTLFAPLVAMQMWTAEPGAGLLPEAPAAPEDYMKNIQINDLAFDPLGETPSIPDSLSYDPSLADPDQDGYYIVQFDTPIKASMKMSLELTGAKIISYVNFNAFVVRANGYEMDFVKQVQHVRWTGVFEPAYKISPTLSTRYDEMLQSADDNLVKASVVPAELTYTSSALAKSVQVASGSDLYLGAYSSVDGCSAIASPKARAAIHAADRNIQVNILTFETSSILKVAKQIKALGAKDIVYSNGTYGLLRATIDRGTVPAIARQPDVMWLELYVQPYVYNDITRWVIQSGDAVDYATPIHDQGIWGTNQTVTVCDSGLDWHHDAFADVGNNTIGPGARKVTDYYVPAGAGGDNTDNGINHGTHVSGTVAGDDGVWHVYDGDPFASNGTVGPHDGEAFDAKIQMQDLSQDGYYVYPPADFQVLYQDALDRGSYIHTNSWGGPTSDYVTECAQTDDFIWDNQDMIVCFSAGNPGSGLGWISSFAASKNVLAVGASGNGDQMNEVASFSGRGPTSDGRLKPDVMAPGVGIWSAHGGAPSTLYNDYWQLDGTSMAAPSCAASAALVRQYYMDGFYPTGSKQSANGFVPSAALVKATIINSAVEMTGGSAYSNGEYWYPNDNQGWGRITLDKALYFANDARGLSIHDERTGVDTGGAMTYQVAIGDGSIPLEFTLVWSDYAGTPFSDPNLVNDLDLVVTAPDGTVYRGNQFAGYNPGSSVPNAPGRDHVNNTECVLVYSPPSGLWTITISGFDVPYGPQPFALVSTGGIATSLGTVQTDQGKYKSDATVNVTLVDTDLNTDPNATDTATVSIWSTTETIPESIAMVETGPATSVFRGSIQLQNSSIPVHDDGLLQVQDRDNITVQYYDANNGLNGSAYTYAYAVVDDDPPLILNVHVTGLRFNRATISWSTDESADSVITYGDSIPPTTVKSSARMTTLHSIATSSLVENTTYYFAVSSTDMAGNVAYDDNGSAYYQFTTPPRPPTAPASVEWPMYQNNPSRQGYSPSPFTPPLAEMWSDQDSFEVMWSSPVLSDDVLYSTAIDGTITARDPYSGQVIWHRQLGSSYYYTCTPAVEDGGVYVSFTSMAVDYTDLFYVYALDALTGETIWSVGPETGLQFSARTAILVADGMLFDSTWNDMACALNTSDGSVVWTSPTSDVPLAGGALGSGTIFYSLYDATVVALDEFTGDPLWKTNLDNIAIGPPLYADGCVFIGSESGTMYCLDASDGAILWQVPGFGAIDYGTPAFDGASIYFGTLDGDFVSLDEATGEVLWKVHTGEYVSSSVALANGYVYGTTYGGNLYVLNDFDGSVVEVHELESGSISSLAVSDGWVWTEDYDGNIYAFAGSLPVSVIVLPSRNASDAAPPSAIDYWINVTNTGNSGPDTFDVVALAGALGWQVDLFMRDGVTPLADSDGDGIADTGSLATNESIFVITRVTVPSGAVAGDIEKSSVSFTSSNDANVSRSSMIVTTVPHPGVAIGPRTYLPVKAGDLVKVNLSVKNAGGFPDTIEISITSSEGWNVSVFGPDGVTPLPDTDSDGVPDTGLLQGLQSLDITVSVRVPLSALEETVDRTIVTATSATDPAAIGTTMIVLEIVPPPSDDWPTFHNDVARRGISPSVFSPPLTEQWVSSFISGSAYAGVAMADGRVFISNMDGYERAFDAYTGDTLWAVLLGGSYYGTSTPIVNNGVVYVVFGNSNGGTLYALDGSNGTVLWSLGPSQGLDFSAQAENALTEGTVFAVLDTGEICAVDASTGVMKWTTYCNAHWMDGIAIGGGMVFGCTDNMDVFALDEFTGDVLWQTALDSPVYSTPVFAHGAIYVGSVSGTMYALDAITGTEIWSTSGLGSIYFSSPACYGSTIYFGTDAGTLYALDADTGSTIWSTYVGWWIESSPAYSNGYIYFNEWDGYLMVLDAVTGKIIESHDLGSSSSSDPAVSNGWVWVADDLGRVHGFKGLMPVGLTIKPVQQSRETTPSKTVNYTLEVTNIGSLQSDLFEINVSLGVNGWPVELLRWDGSVPLNDTDGDGALDTGRMLSGETLLLVVRISVPSGATGGDLERTSLEFTSDNNDSISMTAVIITTVPPPGVTIGPTVYVTATPGTVSRTTMIVKNAGGMNDTFDIIAASSDGWLISLYGPNGVTPLKDSDGDGIVDTGLVEGLGSTTIFVDVNVPASAPWGTFDEVSVTAISSLDQSAWGSAEISIELVTPPSTEWPTYMNNDARHGRSQTLMSPPLSQLWYDGPHVGGYLSSPIVDNGILFFTTNDGYLRAKDAVSGAPIWQRALGSYGSTTGTPAAYNGTIFATFYVNGSGRLYAIDELTGATVWSLGPETGLNFNYLDFMAVDQGMVFGTSWGGEAYAVYATNGTLVWSHDTFDTIYGGPTVAAGMVFVTGSSGIVYAFDESTGSLEWSVTLDGQTFSTPVFARAMVFIGTVSGTLYALNWQNGSTVWTCTGLGMIYTSSPAYDGQYLYIGGGTSYYAIDAQTGKKVWSANTGSWITSSLAYGNGYLYGGTSDGLFIAIDASRGNVAWGYYLNTSSVSAPAIASNLVFVEGGDGSIYAFAGMMPYGLAISPGYQTGQGLPTTAVDYEILVTNIGYGGTDTYDATIISGNLGWSVELLAADHATPLPDTDGDGIPDTGPLASTEDKTVVIRVNIPATINATDTEKSIVRFTSTMDTSVHSDATVVTTLPPPGSTIGPRAYFALNPGDTARAWMNVTNTGPIPDVFELTTTAFTGWPTTLFQQDGMTPVTDTDGDGVPDTGSLPSEGSYQFLVEVQVPLSAPSDALEVITVESTSSLEPDQTDTSAVVIELGTSVSADWPTFHHDNQRTGVSPTPYELPVKTMWTANPGSNSIGYYGPIIDNGKVIATDYDGWIYAFDSQTGSLLWQKQYGYPGNPGASTPAAAYGMVFAAFTVWDGISYQVTMQCLDEETGDSIWNWTTAAPYWAYAQTTPAVAAGLVFWCDGSGGSVYANDVVTGDLVWTYTMSDNSGIEGGPVYWGGILYVANWNGNVTALNGLDGGVLWDVNLGSYTPIFSPVTVVGGVVYVADDNGRLHALDAFTGDALWTTVNLIGEVWYQAPTVADGLVFVGTVPGWDGSYTNFYAIDEVTGDIVWSTVVLAPLVSSVAYNNGSLFLPCDDGNMYVLDAETGNITYVVTFSSGVWATGVAIADGIAVLGSEFGLITAYSFVGVGEPRYMTLTPANVTVGVGQSTSFQATVYDVLDHPLPKMVINWTTESGLGTLVVTGQTGASAIYVAGPAAGYDTITVTSSNLTATATITLMAGETYSVRVTPADASVVAGGNIQFSAYATDRWGNLIANATFQWYASAGLGAIGGDGLLTASTTVSSGTVTAIYDGVQGTAHMEIVPGPLDYLVATPNALTIVAGEATTLSVMGYDQYGNPLSGLTFEWSATAGTLSLIGDGSSAQFAAPTVSGSASITASSGTKIVVVDVTVTPGELATLTIDPSDPSIVAGGSMNFTAVGSDIYGNAIDGLTFAWSSSPSAGTISQAGTLTASTSLATGTVTVTSGQVSSTTTVSVVPGPLASVAVSPSPATIPAGSSLVITAQGSDQYGNPIPGLTFSWSASVGTIGPANPAGSYALFTAPTSVGSVSITATAGGVSGSSTVFVVHGPLATLVVIPSDKTVVAGGTANFTATGSDIFGNEISGMSVTWSASGGTITSNGTLTAPTSAGQCSVLATVGSFNASAIVTVVAGPLDHLELSVTTLSLETGDGADLEVKALDQYGNEIPGIYFSWSTTIGYIHPSADGRSAAFSSGEQGGSGTITVTSGGKNVSASVEISENSITLARQLAQPLGLAFIAVAAVLALLLAYVVLKGRTIKAP
jgi:outer membrane protein assembly factor BamB